MSEDKKIEEIADVLWEYVKTHADDDISIGECLAEYLIDNGYRKATDVAEEIFAEIEEDLNNLIGYYKEQRKYVTEVEYSEFKQRHFDIKIQTLEERLYGIAKLKKKYTEGKK